MDICNNGKYENSRLYCAEMSVVVLLAEMLQNRNINTYSCNKDKI